MTKILVASSIDPATLAELQRLYDVVCAFDADEETLRSLILDRDVLIFRSGVQITASVMADAPRLRLLIRAGSGLDNVDISFVRKQSLRLVRIPGPGAQAVAELTFALMLSLAFVFHLVDIVLRWRR